MAEKKVLVPIADGTDAIEAIVTIDVLRRAGAEVIVASVESEVEVLLKSDILIVADSLISDCAEIIFDLIAFPGGIDGVKTLSTCKTLENIVKKHVAENRLCAAIGDALAIAFGPWDPSTGKKTIEDMEEFTVMDLPEGVIFKILLSLPLRTLLRFKCVCKDWCVLIESSLFKNNYLALRRAQPRVVKDNNFVTSQGPGTAIEYAIALVEQLYDVEKAAKISQDLVVCPNHGDEYTFAELNPVDWTRVDFPQILVPIANASDEMEVVIITEVLRRAGAEVVMASVCGRRRIEASNNVKLVADMCLDELVEESFDMIVLPGDVVKFATHFQRLETLSRLLMTQNNDNKPYGAICGLTTVMFFHCHGLLEGKKATASTFCKWLEDSYYPGNRVLVDGNVATSQAPGTAMEFALVIVEKFFGREKAIGLGKDMLFC